MATGSRTLRRELLVLLAAALLGACFAPRTLTPTPPADIVAPAEPVPDEPEDEAPVEEPPEDPLAPRYIGPGDRCPFMGDWCKSQYIYETSLEGRHATPSAGPRLPRGEAGAPASRS